MSEIGDAYHALHQRQREKKQHNMFASTNLLREKKVPFVSNNNGLHLIVTGIDGLIDFFPTTGKWITRKNKTSGRGVFKLIEKYCNAS